jgi:hypothetical protein
MRTAAAEHGLVELDRPEHVLARGRRIGHVAPVVRPASAPKRRGQSTLSAADPVLVSGSQCGATPPANQCPHASALECRITLQKELIFDATQVRANDGLDSLAPRFYLRAKQHRDELFVTGSTEAMPPGHRPRRSSQPHWRTRWGNSSAQRRRQPSKSIASSSADS